MASPHKTVLVVGIVLLSLALLTAGCGGTKSVIRLHGSDYGSKSVNNAIAKLIVDHRGGVWAPCGDGADDHPGVEECSSGGQD